MADAVGHDAGAEHVAGKLGISRRRAAVGAVPDGEGDAPVRKGFRHGGKLPVLAERIRPAVLIRLVGDGEMGKDPLRLQPRQDAGMGNGLHAVVKMPVPHLKAQAGHAGVHLDLHLQRLPAGGGGGTVRLRLGPAGNRLGDLVGSQLGHHLRRRVAQNQDGGLNPPPAQLPGLVQTGHRQIFRPQPLQAGGYLHRAVAVGVRLHHSQIPNPRSGKGPSLMIIMGQGVQINLRPGPFQNHIVHSAGPP